MRGEDLPERRSGVGEGDLPGEHLEHGDAERIDVAARVDRRLAGGLLRRHVRRSADYGAGLREVRAGRVGQLGDAEIDQLDEIGPAVPVDEEDVVRLEVAV